MTLEFRCADVGVACSTTAKAATAEQLLEKVEAHALEAHGVELNQTLIDYALTEVRESGR